MVPLWVGGGPAPLLRSPRLSPGSRSSPERCKRSARRVGASTPEARAESGPRLSPGRADDESPVQTHTASERGGLGTTQSPSSRALCAGPI
ncbi:hypothetical protein DBR21_18700 [Caulobacter sp. HMWF009]|nr:hypothetical protein DBR21_18700 [Caulobacter sp. HMWF009]PTT08940.1 hypothetical protein DBR10_08095 [Caulobacter sp. HMWF025]